MSASTAEHGGTDRARNLINARPVYGLDGWRASHSFLYDSDSALRHEIANNREDLIAAGALAFFRNRLFAIEPPFSATLLRIAQRRAAQRSGCSYELAGSGVGTGGQEAAQAGDDATVVDLRTVLVSDEVEA